MIRPGPIPRHTPLHRKTWLRRKRKSGVTRGNLGIVRLYGKDLTRLRWQAFQASGGFCQMQRGEKLCGEPITWGNSEMAHVRNKRMYGDVIENVRMSCKFRRDGEAGCHLLYRSEEHTSEL